MDDRAVSTVQTVLAETRWLPVPCPTEYLPALARDVLWALEKAGFSVAQVPQSQSIFRSGGQTWCMWCNKRGGCHDDPCAGVRRQQEKR